MELIGFLALIIGFWALSSITGQALGKFFPKAAEPEADAKPVRKTAPRKVEAPAEDAVRSAAPRVPLVEQERNLGLDAVRRAELSADEALADPSAVYDAPELDQFRYDDFQARE